MRKHSLHLMFLLIILLLANFAVPGRASGQQRFYPPYELYRFHMNGTNGYWYAPWYSIGVNAGYTYNGTFGSLFNPNKGSGTSGIYPRVDEGYTPAPSTGLVPIYQWTVIQGFRSYTYLSTYYASHGSGYYFNGVAGYVYPANANPNVVGTTEMAQWYSQSRGFWYGASSESPPPGLSYVYQGIVCKLPPPSMATAPNGCQPFGTFLPWCDGLFSVPYDPPPPPPPPPTCDPNDEQWCYNSGGWWDSSNCTCNWSQR